MLTDRTTPVPPSPRAPAAETQAAAPLTAAGTTSSYYQPWSDADIALLIAMRREGSSRTKIAVALGRTEGSVSEKVRQLRVQGVDLPRAKSGVPEGYVFAKPWRPVALLQAKEGPETKADVEVRGERLKRYWAARGFDNVVTWIVTTGADHELRSNLVGGFPPKVRP
jgi:biotin operon repressor